MNVPFLFWLLRRKVMCCKDFERFRRRSVKTQTLQESFSTTLMQRPGAVAAYVVLNKQPDAGAGAGAGTAATAATGYNDQYGAGGYAAFRKSFDRE